MYLTNVLKVLFPGIQGFQKTLTYTSGGILTVGNSELSENSDVHFWEDTDYWESIFSLNSC